MSYRFSISGTSSDLITRYFPPVTLDSAFNWSIGLIGLETYHTIPNVDSRNDTIYYYVDGEEKCATIPTGSYEISALNTAIKAILGSSNFALSPNNNTLHVKLFTKYKIDFGRPNTIGSLLGFSSRVLDPESEAGKSFESDSTVSIVHVNTIRVQCNLVSHSFMNGLPDHTLHEFFPNVEPGYKIIEVPSSPVYLPVNNSQIDSLAIRLVDQEGNLLNFRGETISVALHLRKDGS